MRLPHVQVYADGAWNYLDGALETVDRKYGWPIDALHHHISDGHIAHHLFFTQVWTLLFPHTCLHPGSWQCPVLCPVPVE